MTSSLLNQNVSSISRLISIYPYRKPSMSTPNLWDALRSEIRNRTLLQFGPDGSGQLPIGLCYLHPAVPELLVLGVTCHLVRFSGFRKELGLSSFLRHNGP